MRIQEIPIQPAEKREEYANRTEGEFRALLQASNVKDFFDTSIIKIKQDWDKYIFWLNGKNEFAVNNKTDLKLFIMNFYNDLKGKEKRTEEKNVIINMTELEKKTRMEIYTTETTQELADLKQKVQISNNAEIQWQSTDIDSIKKKTSDLIEFFKEEGKAVNKNRGIFRGRKYNGVDKWSLDNDKTEINERLRALDKINKRIQELEKSKKNKEGKTNDLDETRMNIELKRINEELDDIKKQAPDFVLTRTGIILENEDKTPYFDIIGYDKKDIKKLNKALLKINNEYTILNGMSLTTAERIELKEDLEAMDLYIDQVKNHPDTFKPSEHPFIPKHIKEFCALLNIEPTPAQYKELNRIAGLTKEELAAEQSNKNREWTVIIVAGKKSQEGESQWAADPSFTGYKEAIEKYGIRGALHQSFDYFPNMKADQKSFRTNALFLGGMGFALFKGAKWLFSKKKEGESWMGFFWKLAVLWGVVLWTNMLTGKSPLELIDKAINGWFKFEDIKLDFFGKTNEASPDAKKYIVDPLRATCILGTVKIGQLGTVIDPKTFKRKNYDDLLMRTEGENKKILESIGKDDNEGIIRKGLQRLWITPDNLNNLDQNISLDELYKIYMYNIAVKEKYMTDNNLKVVSGKDETIDKLISQGKQVSEADFQKLNADGVFESIATTTDSAEAKKDKEELDREVDLLTDITTEKTKIKTEVHLFYDMMPKNKEGKKEVKIIQSQGLIYLETYGNQTEVNLDKMTIQWFTDKAAKEYVFSSIANALKVANLTNYIKKISKEKTANTEAPFYIDTMGNIKFNNAKLFSTDFDTEIISAWRWGELKNISPILEENKQEYCNYLNGSKPKIRKENKESTLDEIPDKAWLKEEIKKIANGDQAKEKTLLIAMNEFYDIMPTTEKKIILSGTEEELNFWTYDQMTSINLKSLSIKGFTRSAFENTTELFKAANLTNYIKKICKDKVGWEKPFYFRMWEISFNDKKVFSTEFDTGIISTGFLWWLKDISPTLNKYKEEYCNFLNDTKPAFRKIEWMGLIIEQWFEDLPDDAKMKEKISTLKNIDEITKRNILIGMNEFYKKRPNADKLIDIVESWDIVEFKTYNQSTTINLNKKSIEGFTPSRFENYEELFNAVNLTNRIKYLCKERVANAVEPFRISTGWDITFDDAKVFSLDFDTELMAAGRWGSLEKISPILEKYKEYYRDYLNNSKPKFRLDIKDQTWLLEKIRKISGWDNKKERELMIAINEFREQMPNADKDIDIIGSGDDVEFKTYNQTTRINLKTKALKGFTTSWFETYTELFKAANLTNRIRDIVKEKIASTDTPFYISTIDGYIYFDEAKTLSDIFDTKILTTWWGGKLKGISSTLEKFKEQYILYLNTLPKFWKEKIVTK